MPKKLTQQEVESILLEKGCILLSEYINNRTKINILCACKHERETTLGRWKIWDSVLCKLCTVKKAKNNFFKTTKEQMHPKTFQYRLRIMNSQYGRTLKYSKDFKPENINKCIVCTDCKKSKPLYLFFNSKLKKNGKRSHCKKCNKMRTKTRRFNWNEQQFIQKLLLTCKDLTKRRRNRGRNLENSITLHDIEGLIETQQNKCVYTGRELVWKSNHKNKASIDRIDSSIGYIPSNIQLVTSQTNAAKWDMSDEDFMKWIMDIAHLNYKKCTNTRRLNRNERHFLKGLLKTCRGSTKIRRSRGRDLENSITLDDIEGLRETQQNKCIYTGRELVWKRHHKNKASIDRIDSSIGYIPSNIHLVTSQTNAAKSDMSDEDFMELIMDIVNHRLE